MTLGFLRLRCARLGRPGCRGGVRKRLQFLNSSSRGPQDHVNKWKADRGPAENILVVTTFIPLSPEAEP